MSNSSIATVARPEVVVIHNTAASTVTLGAAGAAEILTNGAAQGALGIRGASTHAGNYSAAAGEYTVANYGRMYLDVELRAAKGIAGSIVSFRLVKGRAGDAAEAGITIFERQIPAAAALLEYYIRAQDIAFAMSPGDVLTAQIESDTINDTVAIADLGITYQSIPERLGAEI